MPGSIIALPGPHRDRYFGSESVGFSRRTAIVASSQRRALYHARNYFNDGVAGALCQRAAMASRQNRKCYGNSSGVAVSDSTMTAFRITTADHSLRGMNKYFALLMIGLLALFCSCQKQQTEAERNAEIERQVNERFAAEHQAEEQQRLAQRQTELDEREKALSDKERAAASTPQPQQSVTQGRPDLLESAPSASYSIFYTKLEPFGAWRETSTYGYVWQPREAEQSRGWRPYTNGRWVYTDAGWT